ncbi:MAG: hypothetical protein R3B82_13705 [Sandaracinaceae bacterium]
MSALPSVERPRLAVHVQARVHVADGATHVALFDPRTNLVAQIGLDDWHLVQQADGTRDLDALCLVAARLGIDAREASIAGLFAELAEAGMIADGLALAARAAGAASRAASARHPARGAAGLRAHLRRPGGLLPLLRQRRLRPRRGAPRPAARGRAVAPVADADLFVPVSGAQIDSPDEALAVALVDGRCAFLDPAQRCAIHAKSGIDAKPAACRVYPGAFVHDGVAVRASLAPECACIFASQGVAGGDPLVPGGAATVAALDPQIAFLEVPDPVP